MALLLFCLVSISFARKTQFTSERLQGISKFLVAFNLPLPRPCPGIPCRAAARDVAGDHSRPLLTTQTRLRHALAREADVPSLGVVRPECGRLGPGVRAKVQMSGDATMARAAPSTALLMLIAGLQAGCFGCIGTALPPALRAAGLEPAAVALLLGRLGSSSALLEVMLSGSFGNLADAYGRKPILLVAPAVTILARALVVFNPLVSVLVTVRFFSTLAVPIFWLAYRALLADCFGHDATKLAVTTSRITFAMGIGYAISSIVGGWLAAADVRYAYAASCFLGCCVLGCVAVLRETLPDSRRIPFRWKAGFSPFAFTRLFRRGALSAKLNTVVLLQSLTNGMGDLWQVLARELRGWGAAQCGRFAAFVGVGAGLGTLLTGQSIRLLGPRGHTVATTGSSAVATAILGKATNNAIAYGAILPVSLGASKGQATNARIVNLGEELGVPQGQLSAECNALNAIIKVIAPTLYATLFAIGASHGMLGLPFYSTSLLLTCSALMAASIPAHMWQSKKLEKAVPDQQTSSAADEKKAAHDYWSQIRAQQQQKREEWAHAKQETSSAVDDKKAAQDYWSRIRAQQQKKREEDTMK